MFSGIVQAVGQLNTISGDDTKHFYIISPTAANAVIGSSIAVNGVCLTVTASDDMGFHCDVVSETLSRTNLQRLQTNDPVNLERALCVGDEIGGHQVQGHVEGEARIIDVIQEDDALRLHLETTPDITQHMVTKGFVTLDGMSITLIDVEDDTFSVTLIPHTIHNTIAKNYDVDGYVNVEVDILGKYIKKYMGKFA